MASYKKLCWTQADVLCPFYKRDERENRSICCEGFDQGSLVTTKFRDLEHREKHMGSFCAGRYACCPIYKCTYDAKYREDEP